MSNNDSVMPQSIAESFQTGATTAKEMVSTAVNNVSEFLNGQDPAAAKAEQLADAAKSNADELLNNAEYEARNQDAKEKHKNALQQKHENHMDHVHNTRHAGEEPQDTDAKPGDSTPITQRVSNFVAEKTSGMNDAESYRVAKEDQLDVAGEPTNTLTERANAALTAAGDAGMEGAVDAKEVATSISTEDVKNTAESVKESAVNSAESAKESAMSTAESAQKSANETAESMKESASEMAEQVKEEAFAMKDYALGFVEDSKDAAVRDGEQAKQAMDDKAEEIKEAMPSAEDAKDVATTINDMGTVAYELDNAEGLEPAEVAEIRALETAALLE